MKIFVILGLGLLAGCSAVQKDLTCLKQTTTQALHGDFSDIVLPQFVPGTHLQAGQISSCMK